MSMLVDCSNCRTPLNLPPEAKSIRCALCQAVTRIADSSQSVLPPPPFPGHDPWYPSGYTLVMPSPSPYSYGPASVHDTKKAVIVEEETDPIRIPTGRNMRAALSWLITGCQSGDALLFQFSGHGSRQRNLNGDEIDGYDETLCPLDFETDGMIIDDEINATIIKPLPHGVKLHAIIDSCHSGTVLDLPFFCRMNSTGQYEWEDHRPKTGIWKGSSGGEVISISGCDDDQTSADTSVCLEEYFLQNGRALSKITSTGAMTYCFIDAIEHGNASTYGKLVKFNA
ncbi:hypothetical protein L1987_39168 [Smallanthus sonchifolius]|uniref:Uncharacterized protein n=1 Tax=Smallanthus sonchifolius TaxID=185202 RepID=A0ACB9HMJ5_9ASTR|nr:hypothetical protein L1987_39168 [Smallanthus sonchifolius]